MGSIAEYVAKVIDHPALRVLRTSQSTSSALDYFVADRPGNESGRSIEDRPKHSPRTNQGEHPSFAAATNHQSVSKINKPP